jgi:hypothetical protein
LLLDFTCLLNFVSSVCYLSLTVVLQCLEEWKYTDVMVHSVVYVPVRTCVHRWYTLHTCGVDVHIRILLPSTEQKRIANQRRNENSHAKPAWTVHGTLRADGIGTYTLSGWARFTCSCSYALIRYASETRRQSGQKRGTRYEQTSLPRILTGLVLDPRAPGCQLCSPSTL